MVENYLSTNATYPITYGTAISVACDPQYELMGSQVITCDRGIVYSHKSKRPKCVNRGKCKLDEINDQICATQASIHIFWTLDDCNKFQGTTRLEILLNWLHKKMKW